MQENDGKDSQVSEVEQEKLSESQEGVSPVIEDILGDSPKPRRRFRRLLFWVLSLAVIFAAGVIMTWILRVQPQAAQIAVFETEIASAQEQITVQEEELADLRPLVEQIAKLNEELTATQNHLDILDVLVDVTTAQLALAQEDQIAAKAALEGTAITLSALEATLEGVDAEAVSEMGDRLVLVLDEVEGDAFAARRDLEIVANDLLALERALFAD